MSSGHRLRVRLFFGHALFFLPGLWVYDLTTVLLLAAGLGAYGAFLAARAQILAARQRGIDPNHMEHHALFRTALTEEEVVRRLAPLASFRRVAPAHWVAKTRSDGSTLFWGQRIDVVFEQETEGRRIVRVTSRPRVPFPFTLPFVDLGINFDHVRQVHRALAAPPVRAAG